MWLESIEAKKIRTAPGMYVIVAEAAVADDEKDTVYAILTDDGADKEFGVSTASVLAEETPPRLTQNFSEEDIHGSEYEPVFARLLTVAKALDDDIE